MNKVLADAKSYGKQYLRQKSAAFFTFVFPVLLILIFGSIFGNNVSQVEVPVQNLDGEVYSGAFMELLNQTGVVKIKMVPSDVDIGQYIKDHSLSMAVVIPDRFSQDLQAAIASNSTSHVNVTVYGDPTQSTFGTVLGLVRTAQTVMNYQLADAHPVLGVDVESVAADNLENMDYFLPGVIAITVMTNALYGMTSVCAEYKSRGYNKLLATTTLSKGEWLASKVLVFTIMLSASVVVTYIVGVAAFGLVVQLTPMVFLLVPAGAFLFTSAGMVLGSVAKDAETGSAVANAIGFPMMFLSGSFFPLELMPGFLQTIASGIPLTYLTNALRDTMLFANTTSALQNLGVVLIIGAALFYAGSRLMSWKER